MNLLLERIPSPVGLLLAVSEDGALRALDFEGYESRMQRLLRLHYGSVDLVPIDPSGRFRRAFQAYFDGDFTAFDEVEVRTGGTEFQRSVWAELRRIKPGTTISYGQLAARIGSPSASRAVGLANGSNPVAIVVPCHRVIGANGSLTGFGGGLERKRWLLAHETGSRDLFQA
jgi:methylated-DNA-[protein]-cysteine S-methyltransferase